MTSSLTVFKTPPYYIPLLTHLAAPRLPLFCSQSRDILTRSINEQEYEIENTRSTVLLYVRTSIKRTG